MSDMIRATLDSINAWNSTCYLPKDIEAGTEIGHDARVIDYGWGSRTPEQRANHAATMAEEYGVWVEVPGTVVGEYTDVSSYWTRSNFERIGEDFDDFVLTIGRSSHDGQSLWVRVGDELPEDLYDWVFGQQDYPIYDDSHAGDVEIRIEQDNWQDWGRDEFRREMSKHLPALYADAVADLDDDDVDNLAAAARYDLTCYAEWVSETSESGYWANVTEWAERAVALSLCTCGKVDPTDPMTYEAKHDATCYA